MRLVMMGTGRFALPVFLSLYDSPHDVVGLFTQPDRTGRGHHRHLNPLKDAALEHDTPVFQPQKINDPDGVSALHSLNADLAVVAAYGQILSAEVIRSPRLGCINVHASLLPKYRGAAPIHHAILNGETETGVTIFQIEPKLDAGPMLGVARTPIDPKETTGDVEARLAELAVPLTRKVIDDIAAGTTQPVMQDKGQVTQARSLRKSAGLIDWTQSASQIENHVRAMQPWPTPFTFLKKSGHKPLRVILTEVKPRPLLEGETTAGEPGALAFADQNFIVVETGDGLLEVVKLRPEGKREMTAAEFQHGHALQAGDRFVSET